MIRTNSQVYVLAVGVLLSTMAIISSAALLKPFDSQAKVSEMIRKYPDHVSMVFVSSTHPDCKRCEMANGFFDGFAEDMSGVVKSYFVDCDLVKLNPEELNRLPMCSEEKAFRELPIITFFKPELQDFASYRWKESRVPQDIPYSGAVSVEHLTDFAQQLIPNFSVKLDQVEQLNEFLGQKLIPNKVILFNSKDTTPLVFKGITSQFINRIEFAEVDDLTTQITQQYGVTQFPAILILKWNPDLNDYEVEQYQGQKTYQEIKKSLDTHALAQQATKVSGVTGGSVFADPEIQTISYTETASIFKDSERWTLISYSPKDNAPNSALVEKQIKQIQDRFGSLFAYFVVQCSSNDKPCQKWAETKFGYSGTSSVNILLPYGKKDIQKQVLISESAGLEEIAKEMVKLCPAIEPAIDEDQKIMGQIESSKSNNKVFSVWFYNSTDAVSQIFIHTISANPTMKKYFDFMRYADPKPQASQNWGLQGLPTLRLFFSSNPIKGTYEQMDFPLNSFKYPELIKFLSDRKEIKQEQIIKAMKIEQAIDQEKFEELCLRGQAPCMIALVNKAKEGKSAMEVDEFKQAWAQLKDEEYKWVWLDGLCHTQILKQFGLTPENLPAVVYLETKKLKYKAISGEFTYKNVLKLIETANAEQQTLPILAEELDMDERDCTKIRKIWKENNDRQQRLEQEQKREEL